MLAFRTTAMELQAQQAGQFKFTCGMHVLRARLVIK
ncbi:plastocyanin domain-containing protein [Hymenobacter sp. UYP22]